MNSDPLNAITYLIADDTKPFNADGKKINEESNVLLGRESEYGDISRNRFLQDIFLVRFIPSDDQRTQADDFDDGKRIEVEGLQAGD